MNQTSPIRVGINGFGRIGRIVSRLLTEREDMALVAINDVVEEIDNLSYLYNYDSHYGRAPVSAEADHETNSLVIGPDAAKVFQERAISDVDWQSVGVDIVVDASGVAKNVELARRVVESGQAKHVAVTHAPSSGIDATIIMGINDDQLDRSQHKVVAASICDANAISHPLKALEEEFGIECGIVTTLHPWLAYQNLVDGPMMSTEHPRHYWTDYRLGRASTETLIPKNTTAVAALNAVMPEIAVKFDAFSYRIPTSVVCSADITLTLKQPVTAEQINAFLAERFANSDYVSINEEPLIAKDFQQEPSSVFLDLEWTKVMGGKMVKLIVWFDNEWGYSSRVVDLVHALGVEE